MWPGHDVGLDLAAQLGNSRHESVADGTVVDGGGGGRLDRLRYVEIGLTDAQLDRVFPRTRGVAPSARLIAAMRAGIPGRYGRPFGCRPSAA